MPGFTATRGYRYPTDLDPPDEGAADLAYLAGQFDADLAGVAVDADRVTTIPFVLVHATVQQIVEQAGVGIVVFDTVEEDTANMADLSENASIVRVHGDSRPGWYQIGGYAEVLMGAGTSINFTLQIRQDLTNATAEATAGTVAPLHVDDLIKFDETTLSSVWLTVDWSGTGVAATAFVQRATMWAFWVRDI